MQIAKKTDVGGIFRKYGHAYREVLKGKIPVHHLKVMNAIEDGLLANKSREKNIAICRKLLGVKVTESELIRIYEDWKKVYGYVTGEDLFKCPNCEDGRLVFYKNLSSKQGARGP